ncbi:MAG TPA: FHA domain-containing protein [Thermoanaerobaculia bacterium]|jgi:DNA-binding winged helix-turn-helix (wHTH) protein
MRFRFGDCELDGVTRELHVAGKPVHLTPKAFQFLWLLLESRPRALSKDEIHRALWPGTFVSDGTLTSLLAEVRAAIRDSNENRWIRTVHRFGYAFHGPAERVADTASHRPAEFAYRLIWGPRQIALEEGENVLGRDASATVVLDDKSISRRHVRITIEGAAATIEDLQSKNGTFLGDRPVEGVSPLRDGDAVRVGSVKMTFRVFTISDSTQTAEGDRQAVRPPEGGPAG